MQPKHPIKIKLFTWQVLLNFSFQRFVSIYLEINLRNPVAPIWRHIWKPDEQNKNFGDIEQKIFWVENTWQENGEWNKYDGEPSENINLKKTLWKRFSVSDVTFGEGRKREYSFYENVNRRIEFISWFGGKFEEGKSRI